MQVNVNILNIDIQTLTNKAGKPYKIAEVAYKDLDKNQTQSRKVMSFGPSEKAFAVLAAGKTGPHVFEMEKIGEYWNIVAVIAGGNTPQAVLSNPAAATNPAASGKYDDSARQQLIVRQSSLERAIQFFELTKQTKVTPVDVVSLAEEFKEYVYNGPEKAIQDSVANDFDSDVAF